MKYLLTTDDNVQPTNPKLKISIHARTASNTIPGGVQYGGTTEFPCNVTDVQSLSRSMD